MENRNKAILIRKEVIDTTLANESVLGKRLLSPLKSLSAEHGVPFNILEDKEVSNDAEVHMHEADLWQCLEGKVTFIYEGEMVEPWFGKYADGSEDKNEIKAKEIRGGKEEVLYPGDWLFIPAGVPHQHVCEGTARLVIVKIPKI